MVRLGRIARVGRGGYRDLDTGRFLSREAVQPVLDQARFYGQMGAPTSDRLGHAFDTMAERYGGDPEDYEEAHKRWLREKAEASAAGEDGPDWYDTVVGLV